MLADSLLAGLRLVLVLVRLSLVRFVVTHDASRRGAQLAVACHVSGGPADDGSFDASFGIGCADGGERECDGTDCGGRELHEVLR
jgi:hypothetical protein